MERKKYNFRGPSQILEEIVMSDESVRVGHDTKVNGRQNRGPVDIIIFKPPTFKLCLYSRPGEQEITKFPSYERTEKSRRPSRTVRNNKKPHVTRLETKIGVQCTGRRETHRDKQRHREIGVE